MCDIKFRINIGYEIINFKNTKIYFLSQLLYVHIYSPEYKLMREKEIKRELLTTII